MTAKPVISVPIQEGIGGRDRRKEDEKREKESFKLTFDFHRPSHDQRMYKQEINEL